MIPALLLHGVLSVEGRLAQLKLFRPWIRLLSESGPLENVSLMPNGTDSETYDFGYICTNNICGYIIVVTMEPITKHDGSLIYHQSQKHGRVERTDGITDIVRECLRSMNDHWANSSTSILCRVMRVIPRGSVQISQECVREATSRWDRAAENSVYSRDWSGVVQGRLTIVEHLVLHPSICDVLKLAH